MSLSSPPVCYFSYIAEFSEQFRQNPIASRIKEETRHFGSETPYIDPLWQPKGKKTKQHQLQASWDENKPINSKKIVILPIWDRPGLRTSSGRRCLPGVICGVRTYDTWEVQGCFFALRCSCWLAVEGLLVKNQCCGRGRLSESSLLELDWQFLWVVSGAGKHRVLVALQRCIELRFLTGNPWSKKCCSIFDTWSCVFNALSSALVCSEFTLSVGCHRFEQSKRISSAHFVSDWQRRISHSIEYFNIYCNSMSEVTTQTSQCHYKWERNRPKFWELSIELWLIFDWHREVLIICTIMYRMYNHVQSVYSLRRLAFWQMGKSEATQATEKAALAQRDAADEVSM